MYVIMLVMFFSGAIGMWFITQIATQNTPSSSIGKGSEASYGNLKQSILNP